MTLPRIFIFGLMSLALTSTSFGVASEKTPWDDWKDAKTLYDSDKFDEALIELQAHPREDGAFYFNLGTIYFKLGRIGPAVAYLEKANRMNPHDPDTQYNLSIVRAALGKSIGSDKVDPASSWSEQIADRVSLEEVRTTLGFLGLIVIVLWTRAYLKTRSLRKALFQPAGLLGVLGLSITAGVYGIDRWGNSSPPAISLTRQTVRSGPGNHYLELCRVESGAKLRVLGPTAQSSAPTGGSSIAGDPGQSQSFNPEIWRQVRYSEDGIGWIRSADLLTL